MINSLTPINSSCTDTLCPTYNHSIIAQHISVESHENSMSMFLLPEDVLSRQILPFLKFREVVRLDTALGNHSWRSYFHSSLSEASFCGTVDYRHLEWCMVRKCSAKALRVTSALTNDTHMIDTLPFEKLVIHSTAEISEHALRRLLVDGKHLRMLSINTFYTMRLHHILPLDTDLTLLEIDAAGNGYLQNDVLVALVKRCPHLRTINTIRCYRCTSELPLALATHCPRLREVRLTVNVYGGPPHHEQHTGYCELFQSCKELQNFEHTGHFTITNMETLATYYRELKSVKMDGSYSFARWFDNHVPRANAALSSLVRNNTSIHTLRLHAFQGLNDHSLNTVADHLPDLHTFSLTNCQSTLSSLMAIRTRCTKLDSFEVFYQQFPVPNDDNTIRGYLQLGIITTITIYATTLSDAQLVCLAESNPYMQSLRIFLPSPIIGTVVTSSALSEALSYWNRLENFDVEQMYIAPKIVWIEDSVLYALMQHCPNVATVNIMNHSNVSNDALTTLSNLPLLHTLTAHRCFGLLDSGLRTLAKQCPLLEVVTLSYCTQISDVGIKALAQYCPQLTTVELRGCICLRDDSIQSLIRHARHLQVLDISGNPSLSFAAVAELPLYCFCMHHLRLFSVSTKPAQLETYAAYRSNRRYFDIIFGWSDELRFAHG